MPTSTFEQLLHQKIRPVLADLVGDAYFDRMECAEDGFLLTTRDGTKFAVAISPTKPKDAT